MMFMYWNLANIVPRKIKACTIFDTRKVPSDVLHPAAELMTGFVNFGSASYNTNKLCVL